MVDVGAHVGWFTLLAASYGCRVLAFEPQPHAHTFLNASIVLNGFQDRVTLVRYISQDNYGPSPNSIYGFERVDRNVHLSQFLECSSASLPRRPQKFHVSLSIPTFQLNL